MFLKNIKKIFKLKFPLLSNKLISFRDNNKFIRFILSKKNIDPNKNIHGKQILNFTNSQNNSDIFLSYIFRPKLETNTFQNIEFKNNSINTAIIIQGPIKNYENFVLETIKIYLKIFPESLIILSTWKDEVNDIFFNKIKNFKNFHLILNTKPISKYNVNLQILSTSQAIDFALKKKYRYSLKTRTDCRIYNPNTLIFLKSLLETFKVKNNNDVKNRILASSVDSRIYRVYGLTDICLFSETEDLSKYFINESYEKSLSKLNINLNKPLINDTAVINEIFLCARYISNSNHDLKWSLEDWWEKCREMFCVFDATSIDLFWYKYHWKYEQRFTNNYTSEFNQSLQFADWLNIYNNKTEFYNKFNKEKWNFKNGSLEKKN
tara:strand:- start:1502 stop:2635 length:1134 start_codon:yes stop_codon:yes gene_type:complete